MNSIEAKHYTLQSLIRFSASERKNHMGIRTKILVITILLMVSLSALVGIASKIIVLDSFVHLENQITGEHVDRVVAAIDDTLKRLESTLGDWAHWDDTYEFVAGNRDQY